MDWAVEECLKYRGRRFPELAIWELRREKEKNDLIVRRTPFSWFRRGGFQAFVLHYFSGTFIDIERIKIPVSPVCPNWTRESQVIAGTRRLPTLAECGIMDDAGRF